MQKISTNKTMSTAILNLLSTKKELAKLEKAEKENKKVITDFIKTLNFKGAEDVFYTTEQGELFNLVLKDVDRTVVDSERLSEKYPEIFEDCSKTTTYERLWVTPKAEASVDANLGTGVTEAKPTTVKKAKKVAAK